MEYCQKCGTQTVKLSGMVYLNLESPNGKIEINDKFLIEDYLYFVFCKSCNVILKSIVEE